MKKKYFFLAAAIATSASLAAVFDECAKVGCDEGDEHEELKLDIRMKRAELAMGDNFEKGGPAVEVEIAGSYHNPYIIECIQQLGDVKDSGSTLLLQDGSAWNVIPKDRYVVRQWQKDDPLLIGTASRYFSDSQNKANFRFEAFNQRNGSRARINLARGPLDEHITELTRAGIQQAQLSNQTSWELSGLDLLQFRKWKLGHTIILGINNTLDRALNPYILINVDRNEYARARLVSAKQ